MHTLLANRVVIGKGASFLLGANALRSSWSSLCATHFCLSKTCILESSYVGYERQLPVTKGEGYCISDSINFVCNLRRSSLSGGFFT